MREPFLLAAAPKDYLWGGTRLKEEFAKPFDIPTLAETWECSTHPDGPSRVASGPFAGQTLQQVLKKHPDFLGSHPRTTDGQIPILVKLIDAKHDLSVQVHPGDEYARAHENGSLGKTEMWYILRASAGARLVYGFNRNMDADLVNSSLAEHTFMRYVQQIPVHANDVFYIEPGTLHAIGAGVLLAEIQQNSNITYRLYDYDRVDKNGQPRPLHRKQALEVVRLQASAAPSTPMRVLKYKPGYASELLCRCKYFQVERILLNRPGQEPLPVQTGANSFQVLLCLQGSGKLRTARSVLDFRQGDCCFVPASSVRMQLEGKCQLLKVSC